MSGHVRPEQAVTFKRNGRSRWAGICNDPKSGAINGQKLAETIAQDMNKPSLKLTLHQSFVDWCLLEWQSDPARWTPVEGMQPIVFGAQAQAMRFATGASLQSGYDPRQLSAHIAAKASASASLAEGKAYATTTWPAEDESEWLIYYRDQNNQRQAASLGKFRAKVSAELVGFAGASAMLSAEVHVAMNNGIPQLRGVGDSNRTSRNGEPASLEAGAFAGVRADGKLEGSIEWQDTLVEVPQWKTLSTLGVGAGAALGLGGEARVKLKWSPTTQKFYFNAHAGLVIGAGASGEVGAEVNAGEFPSMLRCIYNGLLTIDFRRLEDIEPEAFELLCNLALRGLIFGISIASTAFELGSQSAEIIKGQVGEILIRVAASKERERIALQTAKNILADTNLGAESWVLYSPPEVKGTLLDLICYDHILTPGDRLPLIADSRAEAIMIILQSSQCWRDYEEMVSRMNSAGSQGDYQANRGRLIRLMRILPTIRLFQLERSLQQTCALPNRPLTFAPHMRLTETRYA